MNIISDYIGKSFLYMFKKFTIPVSLILLFLIAYVLNFGNIALYHIYRIYMSSGLGSAAVYIGKCILYIALKGTVYSGIIFLCKDAVNGYKSSLKDYLSFVRRNWLKTISVLLVFMMVGWIYQFIISSSFNAAALFLMGAGEYFGILLFIVNLFYIILRNIPLILMFYILFIVLEDRYDTKNILNRFKQLVFLKHTVLLILLLGVVQSVSAFAQLKFMNSFIRPDLVGGNLSVFSLSMLFHFKYICC